MELVSIIVVTKRNNITKIIDNYQRQSYLNKELIIIINSLSIDKNIFINFLKKNNIENFKLFQNDSNISLGECYNYAINNREKVKQDIANSKETKEYTYRK